MLVLHRLPGRVRAKHNGLYDKRLSQYITIYCDNLYGVKCSSVNPRTASLLVVFDETKTTEARILDSVEKAITTGYREDDARMRLYDHYMDAEALRNKARRGLIVYGLIYSAFKLKKMLSGSFFLAGNLKVLKAASVVTVVGGYPLIKELYRTAAGPFRVDPDKLLWAASQFFTLIRESAKGVLLLWLKELSDYLKFSADADCFRLLGQNLGETTGLAARVEGADKRLVSVEMLKPGDTVEFHEGEMITAGGAVSEGEAELDSLYYAGHPMVTAVVPGSRVYEGMSVLKGRIAVDIADLPVQNKEPRLSQEDVTAFRNAKNYGRQITGPALALAAVNTLLTRSLSGALGVLLTMSPSAVHSAFSTGMKHYAALLDRNRIYLRNTYVIEKLANVRHIVFDKTGTLTNARMEMRRVVVFGTEFTPTALLKMCAACEAQHSHPIAATIREAAGDYDPDKVPSSKLLPSKGIEARYENRHVVIGTQALMQEFNIDISEGQRSIEESENDYTPVFVAVDGRLAGILVLRDVLRKNAPELIMALKSSTHADITLLTGDSERRARTIAAALGIDTVFGDCAAEAKADLVRSLKASGPVLMVGDGINDALAMSEADVSVSFVDASCDKIKLSSDGFIYEEEMDRLTDLITLSERSYRCIRQSVAVSQMLNVVFGVMALSRRIDIFGAKSYNTVNSLVALGLNQRINLLPAKINKIV